MSFLSKLRPYLLLGLFLSFLMAAVIVGGGSSGVALSANQAIASVPQSAFIPGDRPAAQGLTQNVQKAVLENGLTVLTKEVHTAPVVSVQVWYRVGSRNEPIGVNGISHQLEHLMFKGTSDRPIQFGRLFSALGSQFNAFTSYDETAYFGTVERDKLNALLVLEADRMRNALIDEAQLSSEKRVVISELQGYENSPNYRLDRAVMRAAFPNHPYGLPVGGTRADVEGFTVQEVRNYYDRYYAPENAVLVVVGDFETASALEEIRQAFGTVPRQQTVNAQTTPPAKAPAPLAASHSTEPIVLQQPGSATLIQSVYPLPNITHPDVPAIDLMDMVLTGGRSSRLYQALVETGDASSVGAYAAEMVDPGWYEVSATVAPGKAVSEVDRLLQQNLSDFRGGVISNEELDRAKTQLRASFILGNEDITSQASQIAYNETITGDFRYSDRYLAAIEQVTAADVQRVAKTYLDPARRTVGYFEPTQMDGQAASGAGEGRTAENFSPGAPVDPAEVARYLPPIAPPADRAASQIPQGSPQPLPEQITFSNGLRVLLLEDHSVPTVNLSGWINAGTGFDETAIAGTASLTAANVMNGTRSKDALTLAKTLEDRGVNLGFNASREGVNIDGSSLSEEAPTLVQTLADVLQDATFPADRLEITRQQALIALRTRLDDPSGRGIRTFQQAIYPENHPFHTFPTEASLTRITQENVAQFYEQYYRPDATVLAIVGDFNPAEMRSLLNQSFQSWQAEGRPPRLNYPTVRLPRAITRLNETIPGKTESVTFLGYVGLSRNDPRFYAAIVLNQILGGDTLSSRLGTEVRDRQGLTYGIYSSFQAGITPGPFLISMQTAPEDADRAIDGTLALLRQLRDRGVTLAELETAKRSISSSYPVELANPSSLAAIILSNTIYGLSPEELRQFPDRVDAVTPSQVQQAIRDLIHPQNLVIVTSGSIPSTRSE